MFPPHPSFRNSVEVCWINFFTTPVLDHGFGFVLIDMFCRNHQFHADFCNVFRLLDRLLTLCVLTWMVWVPSTNSLTVFCNGWMNWRKLFNFFTTPVLVTCHGFPSLVQKWVKSNRILLEVVTIWQNSFRNGVHDDFCTVFGLRDQLLTWLDLTWIVYGVPCSFR